MTDTNRQPLYSAVATKYIFFKQAYARLPFLLLILAGISLFLLQNQANGFDVGHHGFLSSHGITLAKNLLVGDSPLLMYEYKELQPDGKTFYQAYNRFPIFPFLLIGFIIQPFEPQLDWQIYAARQLMNFFLLLILMLLFKLVDELIEDRFLALTVALLVASTYFLLRYSDMIFNDTPALFGFVLALYAIVKAQKGQLHGAQLAFFALFPIAMGWQPYAVFTTWLLADFVDIMVIRRHGTSFQARIKLFLHSPSFKITFWAIIWGGCILGLQLMNEWRVVGGNFNALPSVQALVYRTGVAESALYGPDPAFLRWDQFSVQQAVRILLALLPFGGIANFLPSLSHQLLINRLLGLLLLATGFFMYLKYRPLPAKISLIFIGSGLVWAAGMRHFVAFHDFQAIYYIGLAIVLFIGLATRIPPHARATSMLVVSLLFIISVYQINDQKERSAIMVKATTAEFQTIYEQLPAHSKVYIDGDRHTLGVGYHAVDFYLAGSTTTPLAEATYAVSKNANFRGVKLTTNANINLFKVEKSSR